MHSKNAKKFDDQMKEEVAYRPNVLFILQDSISSDHLKRYLDTNAVYNDSISQIFQKYDGSSRLAAE
jgi:hypothetical protein